MSFSGFQRKSALLNRSAYPTSQRCQGRLGEKDLKPGSGPAGPIEKARPALRSLREENQDDRVRNALGLTSDDLLPDVDEKTLRLYHRHLSEKLRFPFEATFSEEIGPLEGRENKVKIIGLLDFENDDIDEFYGLICEAREGDRKVQCTLAELACTGDGENTQIVEDYAYWFWNHRC